jgi:membrane protein YdbS with pleckstrin-like domain
MNANHPLVRAGLARVALVNVAIAGALVLAASMVAALAFELEKEWTLLASLIIAANYSVVTAYTLHTYRRRLKGIR